MGFSKVSLNAYALIRYDLRSVGDIIINPFGVLNFKTHAASRRRKAHDFIHDLWPVSSLRKQKLEELGSHRRHLRFELCALEELLRDLCRHLVPDVRTKSSPIVVGLNELDGDVLGVNPGDKACPPVHFVLQCGKERLDRGVIVAVAGAAARQAHIVGALNRLASFWYIERPYRS